MSETPPRHRATAPPRHRATAPIAASDGKGLVFLALDTVPDYTDTQPLPAGQSALWRYRAIYHLGDEHIGQWSDLVSIPVAG